MNTVLSKPSLVILDRDGVVNQDSDNYIKSEDEWQPIFGSLEAIAKLSQHHIPVAIATNQSGISRGYFSYHTLHRMHMKMINLLSGLNGEIKYIAICPHGPDDNCQCRKPNTGMLDEIAAKLRLPLNKSVYFIGDSHKDVIAAQNAGISPILVRTGKGERTLQAHPDLIGSIPVYDQLSDVISDISN